MDFCMYSIWPVHLQPRKYRVQKQRQIFVWVLARGFDARSLHEGVKVSKKGKSSKMQEA